MAEAVSEFTLFAPSTKKTPSNGAIAPQDTSKLKNTLDLGEVNSFEDLQVDPWMLEALRGLSIWKPTAVQSSCIPIIRNRKDIVAAAKTGSGKTAAFAIPILMDLSREPHGYFALVLTPTRELAIQIAEQFLVLGKSIRVTVCVTVGGLDMMEQSIEMQKRPHIIVATPGRLSDLLSSGGFLINRLRYIVFDEADRLLAPGSSFLRHEIPNILNKISFRDCQWLFFSATMTKCVMEFHRKYCDSQELIQYNGNEEFGTVDTLKQYFMLVPSQVRDSHLIHLLRNELSKKSLIIFVGKCKTCELLVELLRELKITAVGLHGQMSQKGRLRSLAKFKSGSVNVLVTTDVGSRGLDIPTVEIVLNFDLPADARDYVHRVGRAARAGRSGVSISFVHELDIELVANIEKRISKKLAPFDKAPKEQDVLALLNEVASAKRVAGMRLHDKKFGERAKINKRKWAESN